MIKTWRQRCEEHPDHDGVVSEGMIRARMQEEIDELRDALELRQWQGLTDEEIKSILWSMPYEPGEKEIRAIEAKLREKNHD